MSDHYIGLMSGTSVDAIDAVLVRFSGDTPHLIHAISYPWPDDLRRELLATAVRPDTSIATYARLDVECGLGFAAAAAQLLSQANVPAQRIRAIGSHGQTVLHVPYSTTPTSLQIGDPHRIAIVTGIAVVADFRRRDMAVGGQGAPLAPLYHQALFSDERESRAVLNLGGIANLTLLPGGTGGHPSGFDTGPGNTLMDAWAARHLDCPFDCGGAWAKSGTVNDELLGMLLNEPFFGLAPPKSTGRELFNLEWLDARLHAFAEKTMPASDVQATLLALTVVSVADALRAHLPDVKRLLLCGGGTSNTVLVSKLASALPDVTIDSTESYGLHPDWVEASTFAWLAKQAIDGTPVNTPPITGAGRPVVLGVVYPA